jgi:hypothetical protein
MNTPTEQHLGAAFRDLVAEQPFTPDVSAIGQRARQARRRNRIARGGIGAGVIAAAVVTAVGVASAVPSAPAGTAQANGRSTASTGSAEAKPPLVQLAAFLATEQQPKGDATLVERETGAPGHATINVWDLYTDNGRYLFSRTEAGPPAQVEKDNNQGDGMFAREIAAATYPASGNLDTAALKMAWASNTTPVPAWLSAQVKEISAGGRWRGRLKRGRPTRRQSPSNAHTGIPLQIASGPADKVTGTVSYRVTRVNLAGIAVGKF